ncbi:TRAP transporter small permease subunit [Salinarimonas rosea]|uniref:TRAP transporter small permease subunit n=1 Tax=Salinarimonas rosea TaxID=552063 RepID=UPI00041490D4|nr:TRAP transporter small permease [Salinarimonas rosea]
MPDASPSSWPLRLVALLARVNRAIAVVCGVVLLAAMLLILAEIVLRQLAGHGIGGADEISGYVMAGIAAWGFSYALVERAHVRIDVLTGRLPAPGRALFDLLALAALAAVAGTVTAYGWRVLETTLARGSRANTPLETPLWIPQAIWLSGWAWLTLVAALLTLATAALIAGRRWREAQDTAGLAAEAGGDTP